MKIRHTVTAAAALTWFIAAHTAAISAGQQRRGGLPAGEGRDTVVMVCGDCHEAEQMANSYRSRIEWETLVEDMANRNGAASEEQKKIVIAYAVRNFGKANINVASSDDLVQIVQLAPADASAIVSYREKSGEFKTLDDLKKVPGLDFAKIQERKDRIGFTGP